LLLVVPVPAVMPEDPDEEEAAEAVAEATETGAAEADAPVPPAMTEVAPVPFCEIANCWNAAWVLLRPLVPFWGLMEKVIPFPQ